MILSKKSGLVLALGAAMVLTGAVSGAGAQEIEAGNWIKLFDNETLYGWTDFGDAEWTVNDEGHLVAADGWHGWIGTNAQFKDFELEARIRYSAPGSFGLVFRGSNEGHHTENGSGIITFHEQEDSGGWHDIHIKAVGSDITATVDGEEYPVEGVSRDRGNIGIQYHRYFRYRTAPTIEVAELRLRPLAMKSLFNGEDLSGWNILPNHDSEFFVEDGNLRILDGNGQIETEDVYRDFVTQLEIISNGEHLNSGVFFRGPVGEFWLGYESQIRNEWNGDDRTDPVDYGTGAIYGIRPSRKVITSDFEWFEKTIVCHDNYMAVWLDGYLVSEFFDTRPVSEHGDGKNGFVPEAGTIHLQGHDPTTDLSFRNIHIQEY